MTSPDKKTQYTSIKVLEPNVIPANQTLLESTPTQVPSDLLLVGVVTLSSPRFVSFLSQTYNILHQNRLGIPVCLALIPP